MESVTDSISNSSCYCQEITFRPCTPCQHKQAWEKLTTEEKIKARAYKNILVSGKMPSRLMIDYINKLYEKYSDFSTLIIL